MHIFEYKTESFPSKPSSDILNTYGGEGWELCGIDKGSYVFKRRIIKDPRVRLKVTDVIKNHVSYYDSFTEARKSLETSDAALRYAYNHNTLYLNRYKVEKDNDEEQI